MYRGIYSLMKRQIAPKDGYVMPPLSAYTFEPSFSHSLADLFSWKKYQTKTSKGRKSIRTTAFLFPSASFVGAWLHRDGVRSEEQGTCPMCRQLWQYAAQQPRSLPLDTTGDSQISEQQSQEGEEEEDDDQLEVYPHPGLMHIDT